MRPRVGISACLLGDNVRYDGSHKRNAFLVEILSQQVDWVRVCPEVEVGMSIPRETLHLVRENGLRRLETTVTGTDYTAAMEEWAARRLEELAREHLSGYVLKKNSPSCGPAGVAIYSSSGARIDEGPGIFAEALIRRFPGLPIEDEARLARPDVRESFVRRVLEYWQSRKGSESAS
jgi:uncharacterized protein YbbK (DUF523 family)